jgi:ribose 5-phosphate isomerase B
MRVHIGTDHAGFELKNRLIEVFGAKGFDMVDHGAFAFDPQDDYVEFCTATGEAVVAEEGSLGVVIGGSGNGENIAANKVAGVRCALVWNEATAQLARQHNDANVVAIGARQHTEDEVVRFVELFLAEPFSGDERHARRIRKVSDYEASR